MAIILGTVILLLLVHPTQCAQGDTPQPRVTFGPRAGALNVGPEMDAAHRDLRGSEFVGQDLRGACFEGSDLSAVRFWDCDLTDASFRQADLTEVVFDECGRGIRGADFTDAVITGLRTDSLATLSSQQLKSTRSYRVRDLRGCTISACDGAAPNSVPTYDFRGADLTDARLVCGDFTDSDFAYATIDGIEIRSCKLAFAQLASTKNFRHRVLRNMNLDFEIAGNSDFSATDLTGTRLTVVQPAQFGNAVISECTIRGKLRKEDLYATKNYRQGELCRINFEHIDMTQWDLSRQNLTDCSFTACILTGATLEDSVITGIIVQDELRKSTGLTLDQVKSTWNYKQGRMAGIILPEKLAEALKQEQETKP